MLQELGNYIPQLNKPEEACKAYKPTYKFLLNNIITAQHYNHAKLF